MHLMRPVNRRLPVSETGNLLLSCAQDCKVFPLLKNSQKSDFCTLYVESPNV